MQSTVDQGSPTEVRRSDRNWPGVIFLAVLFVLASGLLFTVYRHPGRTLAGTRCARDYWSTRTAGDTLRIDPVIYENGKAPQLSCGMLRYAGELPP